MRSERDWETVKDVAFRDLGRVRGLKGSPFEALYNQAYRRLVAEGKRPKLRKKYSV